MTIELCTFSVNLYLQCFLFLFLIEDLFVNFFFAPAIMSEHLLFLIFPFLSLSSGFYYIIRMPQKFAIVIPWAFTAFDVYLIKIIAVRK